MAYKLGAGGGWAEDEVVGIIILNLYNTIYLFMHHENLCGFQCGAIMKETAMNILVWSSGRQMLLFLLCKNLGMELQGHEIGACLTL